MDETHRSLLDELDDRQEELLRELDELDRRIEFVLAEWNTLRSGGESPSEKAA